MADFDKSARQSTSSVFSDISTPEPSDHEVIIEPASRRASLGSAGVSGNAGGGSGPRVHPAPLAIVGHEVTRQALRSISRMLLQKQSDSSTILPLWQRLNRYLELQRVVEAGLCRLLDQKYNGGVPYYVELIERHIVLEEYQEDFHEALMSDSFDSAKYNFPILQDETLRYYKSFEDEVKPTLKKMSKRGEPVHRYFQQLLQDSFLRQRSAGDLEFVIQLAYEFLSSDGALRHNLTLWWILKPEQWKECDATIQAVLMMQSSTTGDNQYEDLHQTIAAYKAEQEDINNNNDTEDGASSASFQPPVAFIEILPEKKGLARIFPRRRSSQG